MYKPTEWTQSIFANGPDYVRNAVIHPVHKSTRIDGNLGENPNATRPKWTVPGGLSGVTGWKSDLFKYVPGGKAQVFVADIGVETTSGRIQPNKGYKRVYPDGSLFIDNLSYNGKSFEVRTLEKKNGKWDSNIVHEDAEAMPPGYHGIPKRLKCATCHSEAGTGKYGAGLIRGGDFIISDPFPDVEAMGQKGLDMISGQPQQRLNTRALRLVGN